MPRTSNPIICKTTKPLAAFEVPAPGGPFRQFGVTLEGGQRIYVTLQGVSTGIDMRPVRPNNDQINESITILANARAFG